MTNKDIKYRVGFSLIPGIGRVKLSQLENYFDNLEDAWTATPAELKQAGLDNGAIVSITSWRPKISLEAELEKLDRYGVKVLTCHDPEYPSRLKEIYDYPPLLYIRGSLLPEDEWCLAVVGTRRATVYGRQVTEEIAADLARNKITIVSGLAKGIDSVAHHSALEAGGRSIALLLAYSFYQFTATLWTANTDLNLKGLGEFALRVTATGEKLTIAPGFHY